MPFKMTKRLRFLLDEVPKGSELWDIGCDHGLLGLVAVDEGRADRACLVDPAPHAINALRATLSSPRLSEWWEKHHKRVEIILAQGEDLSNRIRGTVVIAGMGGESMVGILKVIKNSNLLLLNPLSHFKELETFLDAKGLRYRIKEVVDRVVKYAVYIVQPAPVELENKKMPRFNTGAT